MLNDVLSQHVVIELQRVFVRHIVLDLASLGLPVRTVADGLIHLTQDSLTLTGTLSAGVLGTVGSGGVTASDRKSTRLNSSHRT